MRWLLFFWVMRPEHGHKKIRQQVYTGGLMRLLIQPDDEQFVHGCNRYLFPGFKSGFFHPYAH